MKNLLLLIAVLGFWGCSSGEKHLYDSEDSAKAAAHKAKASLEEAAQDLKNDAQDLKPVVPKKASGVSSFGDYSGTEDSRVTCTRGDDIRTIAILNGDSGGCGVVYNKFGANKTIAVANYQLEYCAKVQDKVRANLEGPGFSCE